MTPTDRSASSVPILAFGLLFLGAFALRWIAASQLDAGLLLAQPVGDEVVFEDAARDAAAGDWVGRGVLWQAPGTAWLLGIWYALFGGEGRMLFALLGAAGCVVAADLARRLFGARTGLFTGWLMALYAPGIFFGLRIAKPAPATLFLLLALDLVVCFRANPRVLIAGACGLAWAAAALTRENLLLLAPVLVWLVWRGTSGGARWRGLVALAAGGVLGLAPLVVRNVEAGVPATVYTANLGSNLWIGNQPGADGLYRSSIPGRGAPGYEQGDARRLAERLAGRRLDDLEVSAFWRDRALEWMRAEPLAALRLLGLKTWYLLHAREWMDSVAYSAARGESSLLGGLGFVMRFGLLLPLALAGIALRWRRRRELAPLLLTLVVLAASVPPFFIFARFRAPLLPLLAPFAVVAVSAALAGIRRRRVALWPCLLAVIVAILVHLPTPAGERPLAASWNTAGDALSEAGRDADARLAFRRALEADPDHADATFNLGQMLARAGRMGEAEKLLVHAAELQPLFALDARLALVEGWIEAGERERAWRILGDATTLPNEDADSARNAGALYRKLGRDDLAEVAYRAALTLDPYHAGAATDLGWLQWSTGRTGEALASFERALEADPEYTGALVNLALLLASAAEPEQRDGVRALALGERLSAAGTAPSTVGDLEAMALAELGRFREAQARATEAAYLAREEGKEAYALEIEVRLEGYRAGRPSRFGSR